MLLEKMSPTPLDTRRVSFAALMELYENNYLRLRLLCPDLQEITGEAISSVPGTADLHLLILERAPYTTHLRLNYRFGTAEKQRLQPNVTLKMFHDARQVEVLERFCRPHHQVSPDTEWFIPPTESSSPLRRPARLDPRSLTCRWHHAHFLYRWLGFCLHQGHRLTKEAATSSPA